MSYIIPYNPATKTIALISSGFKADYYCDGTADNVQIQAALDSLSVNGGSVYIKSGSYDIATTINVPARMRVYGDGNSTQLNSNGATAIFTFPDVPSSPASPIYITIDNIRFWGNSSANNAIQCGQYGQEFIIRNCWFHKWGTSSNCIITQTNKKFQIIDNIFGGSSYDDAGQNGVYIAIKLSATGDVEILGNIFVQYFKAISGISEKTQIVGNNIYSSQASLSPNTIGIELGTTSGLQIANITGNTISDCDTGVKCNQSTDTGGLNIVGNFFRNIEGNAIYLRGAYHTVTNNYCQDIARSLTGNNAVGIFLADGAQYIKVMNNNIYNSHTNMTYGISVTSVAAGSNTVSDNSITGAQTSEVNISVSATNYGNILRSNTSSTLNGEAAHTLSLGRSSSTTGSGLTIQAGGALSGGTNLTGGTLTLASGTSTGSVGSQITFSIARDSQGSGTTDRTAVERMRLSSSSNGRLILGTDYSTTGFSVDGISMTGAVARTIQLHRNNAGGGAGLALTIKAGGAHLGETNFSGGNLILQPGVATGTGTSQVLIQTPTPGSSGTTDTSFATRLTIDSNGLDVTGTLTATTYLGQSSITTLGTIATGTWNGTAIAVNYGGTGAATLTGILKGNGTSAITGSATTSDLTEGSNLYYTSGRFDTAFAAKTIGDLTAPTANFSMNSHKITSLTDPSSNQDAATKAYVDSVATGLNAKASCQVATTTNITLSGEQTIDGVLTSASRILVKNQSTASQNGIYVTASGAWSRSTDADVDAEVTSGMYTFVTSGTTQASTGWVLTTTNPITLGVTSLTFTQFSAAVSLVAGNGLTLTGSTLDVVGTSGRIVANADSIDLASGIVSASTYKSVTVDTYGRVTAGTNPTTLSGYGITDAQPLDSTLTSLAAYNTNGILTQTAADTFTGRTVIAGSASIVITNGNGVSGNPTIDTAQNIQTSASPTFGGITISGTTSLTGRTTIDLGSSGIFTITDSNYGAAGFVYDSSEGTITLGSGGQQVEIDTDQPVGNLPLILANNNFGASSDSGVTLRIQTSVSSADYWSFGIHSTGGSSNFQITQDSLLNSTTALTIDKSLRVGIGTTSPTAVLHLKAGTATANTAPFKLTSGTNLTSAEAGAVEWDGSNLYISQTTGPTRKTILYSDFSNVSGTLAIANGGTGQTTKTAAMNALSPLTTQGDIMYHNGTDSVRLAKGTAFQHLRMNSGATAPEWDTTGLYQTVKKTADQTIATTTLTDCTDLSFTVVANTDYFFEFFLVHQSALATTGLKFAATTATATVNYLVYETDAMITNTANGTANIQVQQQQSSAAAHTLASQPTLTTNYLARIWGVISVSGTGGTLKLQFAGDAAANITAKKGSYGRIWI